MWRRWRALTYPRGLTRLSQAALFAARGQSGLSPVYDRQAAFLRQEVPLAVLGIDIGGNQIRAGMVDPDGAIVASRTIPTPADLDTFLPSFQEAIGWLVESTDLPSGVGVGCKGMIDPATTDRKSTRLNS